MYLAGSILDGVKAILANPLVVFLILSSMSAVVAAYVVDGPHKKSVRFLEAEAAWYGWWVLLGIASSIGLGTGLHTFVLFLGPHIAQVTLTAYKCGTLNFEDRGPFRYTCPTTPPTIPGEIVSIFTIYAKIRLESFFWGLGTSIGELPPYFVARAAAAAGKDDVDFNSIERILEKDPTDRTIMERGQVAIFNVVQKFGFYGIVLCASIPNPLFDLAGIICGHFGVPFMTFWGATFVGKALVKNNIQAFAIVVLFSKDILDAILSRLEHTLPWLHTFIRHFLDAQMRQFEKTNQAAPEEKADSSFFVPANVFSTKLLHFKS
ncbi:hypothetical protein HK101_011321 [Irineochytrium annulatum]|nr:hypothetical protein HK101_011321 [Irineochytrium annulatum]